MKVVILCGGMGTRLCEETEFRPKPMVTIGGRPILWHIMKLYAHYGLSEFVLCLGYRGSMIKEHFLNYEAMNNDFTIELGGTRRIDYHDASPACTLEREPIERLAHAGELMAFRHEGAFYAMDTYREFQLLNDMWEKGQAPWKVWA